MNWKKSIFAATAIAGLAMSVCGCENIMDDLVYYEGPRKISSEAQQVVYVPTEETSPKITMVYYWLIQDGTEEVMGTETKYAEDAGEIFDFDFFSVITAGQNIVLDIDENTSDCYREITVDFLCEGYDPNSLFIIQLPADKDLDE